MKKVVFGEAGLHWAASKPGIQKKFPFITDIFKLKTTCCGKAPDVLARREQINNILEKFKNLPKHDVKILKQMLEIDKIVLYIPAAGHKTVKVQL